jgi:pimeloyl-ACP methyl ester carboxylesterase
MSIRAPSGGSIGFGLIHGGLHAAWCWNDLRALLHGPVVAVDLPGRDGKPAMIHSITADDWAEHAAAAITALPADRIVLVGHSLGGLTTLNAAKLLGRRIVHLVFAAALVPAEGQTIGALIAGRYASELFDESGAFPVPPYDTARRLLVGEDMSDDQAHQLYARLHSEPPQPFLVPFDHAGVPQVPRTYVRFSRDAAVTREMQDVMIANLGGCEQVVVDGPHNAIMTNPAPLAAMLNAIE